MSGSAVADAAALGTISIDALSEQGSDKDFATGLVAGVSLMGPIIPPRIPAVLDAILAGVSVNGLLIADIIPGLLIGGMLKGIFKKTAVDSAIVMFILGVSNICTWLLTSARIPQLLSQQIFAWRHNYALVLLLITLLLLLLGCFVSSSVSINLLTPIVAVGGDPLFFGVFMILVLMIGELTPPLGMVLFALMRVTGFALNRVVRASLPFYIPVVVVILLCAIFQHRDVLAAVAGGVGGSTRPKPQAQRQAANTD